MTTFSAEDAAEIAKGGNAAHNSKYLSRHNGRDAIIQSGTDATKRRDYIRQKYVDKKWYSEDGSVTAAAESPAAIAADAKRRFSAAVPSLAGSGSKMVSLS